MFGIAKQSGVTSPRQINNLTTRECNMRPITICIHSDGNVEALNLTVASLSVALSSDVHPATNVKVIDRSVAGMPEAAVATMLRNNTFVDSYYRVPGSGLACNYDWAIRSAKHQHVLSVDEGVTVDSRMVSRLARFYDQFPLFNGLMHGVLCDTAWQPIGTTVLPDWVGPHFGMLDLDTELVDATAEMKRIPMGDFRLFAVRRDAWLGFANGIYGSHGLAGPIHEKYRLFGQHTWCIPFMRWQSSLNQMTTVTSPDADAERMNNIFCGFYEVGMASRDVLMHFMQLYNSTGVGLRMPQDVYFRVNEPTKALPRPMFRLPRDYAPFMGYTIGYHQPLPTAVTT